MAIIKFSDLPQGNVNLSNTKVVGLEPESGGATGERNVLFTIADIVAMSGGGGGGNGYTGSKGDTGFTGSQGATGPIGPGTVGFTGSQGDQGIIGFTGSQGATGPIGPGTVGFTGSQGTAGFTGSAGFNGSTGFNGSKGDPGLNGFTGSIGSQGTVGFTGSKGVQGDIGFTGSKGVQGDIGFTGSKGVQGDVGFTGSKGVQGDTGFTGSKGDQGDVGFTGSASTVIGFTGSKGDQGDVGFTGSLGGTGFTGSASTVAGPTGFTGSKGDAGDPASDTLATTSSIANTNTDVYNSNGPLPADPKGMAVADPSGAGGWYWISPGPSTPAGLNSFQWKMFNNNGPQTYTVADIDYIYMVVDLYTVGQVYVNVYTGTGPIATTFTSRFSFTLNGDFANTGRFLMWAKPPGSATTVDDVEVYPFLERLELPYAAVASSGPLLTSEPIKSLNVQTRANPALTAGEVEFNLKNVGYKVSGQYIQNFDMDIYAAPGAIGFTGSQGDTGFTGSASTVAGPTGFTGSQGAQGIPGGGSASVSADANNSATLGTDNLIMVDPVNVNTTLLNFDVLPDEANAVSGEAYLDADRFIKVKDNTPVVRAKHAFIFAGQSNMVGRATFDNGTSHPANSYMWSQNDVLVTPPTNPLDHLDERAGDMGLDIGFAQAYAAANPDVDLVLIPVADGGTGFGGNNWNPGNSVYENMVTRVTNAFNTYPDMILKGFLWHQGESDKSSAGRANYPTAWNAMIDDFIARSVMTIETPTVVGGILENDADSIAMNVVIEGVADARAKTTYVDIAALTSFDNLHFDSASLRGLGTRYYDEWVLAQTNSAGGGIAEVGAQAHWLFGSDNPTNADLISGRQATVNIPLATTTANYVQTADQALSGLDSQIPGAVEQTVIVVCQALSDTHIRFGNLKTSAQGNGRCIYWQGDRERFNDRNGVGFIDVESPLTGDTTQWIFGAYTYTVTGSNIPNADVGCYTTRPGQTIYQTGFGLAQNSNTDNIGFGNLHYADNNTFGTGLRVAEAIMFDRALTKAELDEILERSRTRMADRGITLVTGTSTFNM
jgi:hypothetical protein